MTTKNKILRAIRDTIPQGVTFSVSIVKSGVGDTEIVRVVTPAWKTLPPFIRVMRVQKALESSLTFWERQKILRVSVFTPQELLKQISARAALKATIKVTHRPSMAALASKLKAGKTNPNAALLNALRKLKKK